MRDKTESHGREEPKPASEGAKADQKSTDGVLRYLVGPALVGMVLLIGQAVFQPKIAAEVKRAETILEQRYAACNDAFNALLRRVERASVHKGEVRYRPAPTQDPLTAIEINSIVCRLSLFCSDESVPRQFSELMTAESMGPSDIGEFVLNLREEMNIRGTAIEPNDFPFAYPTATDAS